MNMQKSAKGSFGFCFWKDFFVLLLDFKNHAFCNLTSYVTQRGKRNWAQMLAMFFSETFANVCKTTFFRC